MPIFTNTYFSAEARVLVVTGTHGDLDSGLSGLTDTNLLDHVLYTEDCRRVGVEDRLPVSS